jgi:hypothetical protein
MFGRIGTEELKLARGLDSGEEFQAGMPEGTLSGVMISLSP